VLLRDVSCNFVDRNHFFSGQLDGAPVLLAVGGQVRYLNGDLIEMMKFSQNKTVSSLLALTIVVCLVRAVNAQQSPAKQTDQDDIVRVKTDLVQVRAVVTDKKGQLVENLTQDDFEILENGKAQSISFFAAARVEIEPNAPVARGQKPNTAGAQTAPKPNAKPARTIVLFVDTLHLTALSLIRAKQQLKQFVDEKMTEQDMAAVVTTSSSLGVLQQFMRDRKMLKYAIDKISGFNRSDSFFTPYLAAKVLQAGYAPHNPGGSEPLSVASAIMAKEEGNFAPPPEMVLARARQILEEESVLRRSTLLTIKAVSEQMADLPGQRMIAFVSDGFTLQADSGAEHQDFFEATGRSARSGVVIYSFSPKGLATPVEFTANAPTTSVAFGNMMHDSELDQQDTLRDVAHVTGGEAFLNSNDVVGQFKKMLDANRIYYALGYYPRAEADRKFRNIKVRIKNHPDYHIRTQTGYQPITDKKAEVATTPQQKLFQAMIAPLPLTTIGVISSADFLERSGDDAQVTLQVHFAGDLLEYPLQDQKHLLNCEVVVAVFDHDGKMANSISEAISAGFTAEQMEKAKLNGYRYSKRLTLAPGLYQLRIGVRDVNGGLMGTSMSWAEVPDLRKKKLTLSNIFLGKEKQDEQGAIMPAVNKTAKLALVVGQGSFKPKESIFYRFVLYNSATIGPALADLQLKVEVLESGSGVDAYDGSWQALGPRIVRSDASGLEIGGQLKMDVGEGIYTLRVTVKDPRTHKQAQQTIAFEIAP